MSAPVGRPRHYEDRVSIALRLPRELAEALDAAAEDRDVSRNWLICRLLAEAVPNLVPAEELLRPRDLS